MSFPLIFPLTFVSSAFVPGRLDAELAAGLRHLPAVQRDGQRLPVPHDRRRATGTGRSTSFWVVQALPWTVGLLIVFIPLAIRRYRTRT